MAHTATYIKSSALLESRLFTRTTLDHAGQAHYFKIVNAAFDQIGGSKGP